MNSYVDLAGPLFIDCPPTPCSFHTILEKTPGTSQFRPRHPGTRDSGIRDALFLCSTSQHETSISWPIYDQNTINRTASLRIVFSMPPDLIVPRARGTMILMLILGVLLAGGHHAFYKIHDGKPPSKATYSIGGIFTSLTSQQINLAAGAALAFLVKASLGIAIAKSAEQATWCSIRTKTLKLATIDKLSTSTTNILSLFDIQSWRGSWTTMIPALIYWYVR